MPGSGHDQEGLPLVGPSQDGTQHLGLGLAGQAEKDDLRHGVDCL
jgi:hypothetical protein